MYNNTISKDNEKDNNTLNLLSISCKLSSSILARSEFVTVIGIIDDVVETNVVRIHDVADCSIWDEKAHAARALLPMIATFQLCTDL